MTQWFLAQCNSGTISLSLDRLYILCISCRVSSETCSLNRELQNARRARNLPAPELLLPSFAWWGRRVEWFVDLVYLLAGRGEKFFFAALTIVVSVDFVVGQDVGCCNMASCVIYLKVGTFDQLVQSKIRVLTDTKMGIVRGTIQHELIVSVSLR